MNTKLSVGLKCLATGIIYALVTCIIQVPLAEVLGRIMELKSDSSISDEMLPQLLFSLFLSGTALALFFYLNGHVFTASSKWKHGLKFALFVYISNYIAQVFFLDADEGLNALISGGFPVIQVELFDLIILIITVLIMVRFMPCRHVFEKTDKKPKVWKCLVCGLVFAAVMVLLNEAVLPLIGFPNMASGLKVSSENMLFFYSVMAAGFFLTGTLVSYYAYKANDGLAKGKFITEYGILVWCIFDITMIPLGYGVPATAAFMFVSMVAFTSLRYMNAFVNNTSSTAGS